MLKLEVVHSASLQRELGPGDEIIWGDVFDNRNASTAVYHLGARRFGDLTALREADFRGYGLNKDEIAVIKRVLGAPGRNLSLAPEQDVPMDLSPGQPYLIYPGNIAVRAELSATGLPSTQGQIIPFPQRSGA